MLKAFVKSLSDVDAKWHELYEKSPDGDGFVLKVDEKDWKSKIDEFRSNNRGLKGKVDAFEAKYGDLPEDATPEQIRAALEAFKALEQQADSELLKKGKFEEVLNKRTESMRKEYDKKLKLAEDKARAAEEKAGTHFKQVADLIIDREVRTVIGETGKLRHDGAMQDVLLRARTVWSYGEDGKMVAKNSDGTPLYGKKGNEALTLKEWAEGLRETAPHLWEPSAGGGGKGNPAPKPVPGQKTISRTDPSFVHHADKIATGEMRVVD